MPIGSQFSLSLELTKLVPFGSLFHAAGHGLVQTIRELQASGSDFISEQDLAKVFGRNQVDALFASTFRTAVKHSVIHEVSSIAELIIEGGAGPTVKRSLKEPGYFSMVVQLSLLTFTHELQSLTQGLTRAFERRAQGAEEYVAPPRYDAMKGVLRSVREQTCGFMWELIISAVEHRLYPNKNTFSTSNRAIGTDVLHGLLDSFTAVQHLPERTRLRITTSHGIPTIVVWAHHVLGLTVKVELDEVFIFGEGQAVVYVNEQVIDDAKVVLLNETNDHLFHLGSDIEDTLLQPVRRLPIRDYGTTVLRLYHCEPDTRDQMMHAVVAACIVCSRVWSEYRDLGKTSPAGANNPRIQQSLPSVKGIMSVSKMLFASNRIVLDGIDPDTCVAPGDLGKSFPGGHKISLRLAFLIFVLGMVQNLDEEMLLHFDSLDEELYMPFREPDPRSAFVALASLLQGHIFRPQDLATTSVVSAWGWTLCLAAVTSEELCQSNGQFFFVRGVPVRRGERRRYIVDGAAPLNKVVNTFKALGRSKFTAVSGPGETCSLTSWTRPLKTRFFVGVTDDAFEVTRDYSCEPSVSNVDLPNTEDQKYGWDSMESGYGSKTSKKHTISGPHSVTSLRQKGGIMRLGGIVLPKSLPRNLQH
ncbi:MAG: hypothetical protein Q9209_003516 [Squamulea sp. 1 TL-2023]